MRYPDPSVVIELFETGFDERIFSQDSGVCSSDESLRVMDVWRQMGCTTVFNAGTFDVLTPNHTLSLVQCRIFGAMALNGLSENPSQDEITRIYETAGSDAVRLMITLDTNQALEEGKSRRADKGGAPKPILDWSTRAMTLATQSIPLPNQTTRRQSVDYITCHGPGCCNMHTDGSCTNEDNALMTVRLQPDVVVVNSQSHRTIADLTRYRDEGRLPTTWIALLNESEMQYTDPVLGGPVSSTSIAERTRS